MPETAPKESTQDHIKESEVLPATSSGTIASCWRKFHFSGRVIICSVLFGFGLILIGGILFAINMNDDSSKSLDGNPPNEIPTKAPSNVVGPVVMGIGSFIVIVGIVMCLFETQVCRKKTGDSSPLISDGSTNSESAAMLSTSHSHSSHRHGTRKPGASPKRSKKRHSKPHSQDRNQQKTPSPRSPPVTIETTRSFMTSSEDKFLTPPNTLSEHPALTHSNSRDAENQTSSSLMKSFTSSGPSWSQSNEFQTPSTSFRDTSVSLNSSIEVEGNQDMGSVNTSVLRKLNSNTGFLTPVTLEEEKLQNMADQLQHQKDELSNMQTSSNVNHNDEASHVQYSSNVGLHLKHSEKDKLTDESTLQISGKDQENMEKGSNELRGKNVENSNQDCEKTINITTLKQPEQSLNTQQNERFLEGSHHDSELINSQGIVQQDMNSSVKKTVNISKGDNAIPEIVVEDENHHMIPEYNTGEITESNEDMCKDALEINRDKNHLSHNSDESTSKIGSEENDSQNVLESSVSSDETVVSQDSVLEIPSRNDAAEKNYPESEKTNETLITNIEESENIPSPIQNDGTNTHLSQSSMKDVENPSKPADCGTKDMRVDENDEKESKDLS